MSEQRRSVGVLGTLAAGAVIGDHARLSRASIERMEAEEPSSRGAHHRWFARTPAERMTDRMGGLDTLLD